MERAVVIGGGFAGVAAACRLAGDGHRPILLERARRLGGRAGSYVDGETGETIDYGHHVLMHCCTASRGFLARIGASEAVRFQSGLRIPILCDGRTTLLRSSLLPGPAHLAPSLLAYRPIPMRDRLRALRAGAALLLPCRSDKASFSDWLGRHGQSETAIARLWNPISTATLNAPVARVSGAAARQVFRDGFFVPGGANIGLFARPLSEIFDKARVYLERHDAELRTRAAVARVLIDENAVRGVELADGEVIECDVVVAAVPPDALRGMLKDGGDFTRNVGQAALVEVSPIVDVHVWFDRSVMEEPFVIAVDAPIQTIFDLGRLDESGRPGGHVVVSQSAAVGWMQRSSEEIGERVVEALRELLPSARGADCLRRRVIKHPRATFLPAPGSQALRPTSRTPVAGLVLAGDWTATGWPSTIEGAVRSGVLAAGACTSAVADFP